MAAGEVVCWISHQDFMKVRREAHPGEYYATLPDRSLDKLLREPP